jgi:hypothetical protein
MIYRSGAPYEVLQTKWLSFDEVLAIKQVEEMLEVYYNSGQFGMAMRMLEPLFDSAFTMYQELGRFYDKKGYFGMSHSRMRRCEILLEFLEEQGTAQAICELLKESLVYDLYERENCKSRPSWAADMSEWKELTRKYCTNGKQGHVEQFHYNFPGKEVRSIEKLPVRCEKPIYLFFDYTKRNPLDYQAEVKECYMEDLC